MIQLDGFDEYLQQRTDADLFAGVIRLDRQRSDGSHETVFEQGYGLASRAWRIPCTPDIRFDTASITKLFTTVAALQQVEAGAFGLDTPVIPYLGLEGTKISDAVTPYHLLTHTSGIGDDADEEAGERYEDLFVDRPNYALRELIDILPNFVDKDSNFAPGQGCRYCNVSYVLLGLMVERATGRSYRDYVTERVFEAAGMDNALFAASDVVTPRIAEGAEPIRDDSDSIVGWKRNIFSYPPIGAPDGGSHVTAGDLMAFHRALRGGRLLSKEMAAEMLTPRELYRTRGNTENRWGYGFEFSIAADGEVLKYWKDGINVGVSGILGFYPRDDIAVAVLCTMEDGAWEPVAELDRRFGVSVPLPDTID